MGRIVPCLQIEGIHILFKHDDNLTKSQLISLYNNVPFIFECFYDQKAAKHPKMVFVFFFFSFFFFSADMLVNRMEKSTEARWE